MVRTSTKTSIDVVGLDDEVVALTADQLADFEERLVGPLLFAGDDGWDDAISLWNAMVAKTPAVVVRPHSPHDVAAAVEFAREHHLLIGIKGGGHNIAGTAIAPGGLTLDMSGMRAVVVDAQAKRAHVGPGCLLKDVDQATQRHSLATVLGFVSEVGIAGLTLGGGLGYLTRRFGWTVDNLEEVEVVTADGKIRTANRDDNADLFWAIRGGGGNFGVVTRFTFRLHDVGPTVYGGLIAWPFDRADEILRAYRALTTTAPRELTAHLVLSRAPAAPFVPHEWHGKRVCAMAVCYSGDLDTADRALLPIRALRDPILDLLRPQPYTAVQSQLDATEPRGKHYYWKTQYAAELSDDLLTFMREAFASCPIPEADLGILHLGGALNEHADDDGAVGNRDARYAWGVKGLWDGDAPDPDAYREWIRDTWARFRPFSTGGNYINFQSDDDGSQRITAAYGANFERLRRIKTKYDPQNLFRVNRNIPPDN